MTIAKQIIGTFCSMKDLQHELVVPVGKQITISTMIVANYAAVENEVAIWVERADEWWSDTLTPEQLADFVSLDKISTTGGGYLVPFSKIAAADAKYLTLGMTLGPRDRIRAYFPSNDAMNLPVIYVSIFGSVEDRGTLQDVVIPIDILV